MLRIEFLKRKSNNLSVFFFYNVHWTENAIYFSLKTQDKSMKSCADRFPIYFQSVLLHITHILQ